MQDAEFFDYLFQVFARTTGAENTYWMVEETEDDRLNPYWVVSSMAQDQTKTFIASFENEVDADFVTAIAGCMPDLVRRLHDALDEADRLDTARDEREQEIGRLTLENMELKQEIEDRRSKAADVLWKIERPM